MLKVIFNKMDAFKIVLLHFAKVIKTDFFLSYSQNQFN